MNLCETYVAFGSTADHNLDKLSPCIDLHLLNFKVNFCKLVFSMVTKTIGIVKEGLQPVTI